MSEINEIARLNKTIEQLEGKETRRLVEEVGLNILAREKFVLPEDEAIRNEYLSILFEKLEDSTTRIKNDGKKILVVDERGFTKENAEGTRELTFEELLKTKARRYFPHDPSGKGKPALKQAAGMPDLRTKEDFFKALNNERDPAKSRDLMARYKTLVEKGVIKA